MTELVPFKAGLTPWPYDVERLIERWQEGRSPHTVRAYQPVRLGLGGCQTGNGRHDVSDLRYTSHGTHCAWVSPPRRSTRARRCRPLPRGGNPKRPAAGRGMVPGLSLASPHYAQVTCRTRHRI
jgi:hypothetical protein